MALILDPEAESLRDLAKRCVPEGGQLEAATLLSALYHGSRLRDLFPPLARHIPPPLERRAQTPAEVPVAPDLRPVMRQLAAPGAGVVTPEAWFLALLQSPPGMEFALSVGIPLAELDQVLAFLVGNTLSRASPTPAPPRGWRETPEREQAVQALGTFGRMLTMGEPIQKGIVELDRPLRALLRALVKRKQRSALVIGQPGTGKSALVHELARRLMAGDPSVPPWLRDNDVFELSPTFLRSGTSLVGQYEERVGSLLRVLTANPKVILFVDEVHSMLQSGIHERGAFTDANEAFKQAIAQGDIALIGCTTLAEYRHHIEPDQALAQRFSTIRLEPPSPQETRKILRARRPGLEAYYGLRVPDPMLDLTVDLTEEHLPGRAQPRKSIQLLDEACAYGITHDPPAEALSEELLWQSLEDTIGRSLLRGKPLAEEEVFGTLRSRIVGQDETLRAIARAFIAGLGGWTAGREAPRGVFFFCGPTGVGKTETALLLARILGGGRESLIRVDCNTLQGSGRDAGPALHILLGVPPGYLGYVRGKGGVLSRIRDYPEGIVLFDEIEKADAGVGTLLLQIMDDGRCEDNDGNLLDFRRAFLVFTTNAGAVYQRQQTVGFLKEPAPSEPTTSLDALKAEIRAMGLGEEFLGRISHFFVFQGLRPEAVRVILQAQLGGLSGIAAERGYRLEWDDAVVDHLVSRWQPRFGVRHLVVILRNRVVEQLSVADAQGELKGVQTIRLELLRPAAAAGEEDLAGLARCSRRNGTLVIGVA